MKRIIAILLSLAMAVSMMPQSVNAAEGERGTVVITIAARRFYQTYSGYESRELAIKNEIVLEVAEDEFPVTVELTGKNRGHSKKTFTDYGRKSLAMDDFSNGQVALAWFLLPTLIGSLITMANYSCVYAVIVIVPPGTITTKNESSLIRNVASIGNKLEVERFNIGYNRIHSIINTPNEDAVDVSSDIEVGISDEVDFDVAAGIDEEHKGKGASDIIEAERTEIDVMYGTLLQQFDWPRNIDLDYAKFEEEIRNFYIGEWDGEEIFEIQDSYLIRRRVSCREYHWYIRCDGKTYEVSANVDYAGDLGTVTSRFDDATIAMDGKGRFELWHNYTLLDSWQVDFSQNDKLIFVSLLGQVADDDYFIILSMYSEENDKKYSVFLYPNGKII